MTVYRRAINLHFSDMIKINEVIVVEGKYDKIKLQSLFDTLIVTTDGFRIYKNKEKVNMFKLLAEQRGIILLTDSDKAGLRIRNKVREIVGDAHIKNVYIPQIEGKEKRKDKAGAEGFLGVEGVSDEIIINAVMSQTKETTGGEKISKSEFYSMGFSGSKDSKTKRQKLAKIMGLPINLSATALLDTINVIYQKQQFYDFIKNQEDL